MLIFRLYVYIVNRIKYFRRKVKFSLSSHISLGSNMQGNNKIGKNTFFHGTLGKCSYIGSNCQLSSDIGMFSSIGDNVRTISGTHPVNYVSTSPIFYSIRGQLPSNYVSENKFQEMRFVDQISRIGISIGNDVWIGYGVTILSGLKIGDGSIVLANATVTKDVPPYSIVSGIPAKIVKYRFEENIIKRLVTVKWWNKDEKWIVSNIDSFYDVNVFLSLFDREFHEI